MKILELRQLKRTENGLYYRRKFSAEAAVEIPIAVLELPILFTIETSPFGTRDIDIEFLKAPDYPLIPIKTALLKTITELDTEGKLP
ncbi:MAG: hypothetical protein K5640_00355 [Treponema sp.]|nr:hypothetical protein [Treponema sp.]